MDTRPCQRVRPPAFTALSTGLRTAPEAPLFAGMDEAARQPAKPTGLQASVQAPHRPAHRRTREVGRDRAGVREPARYPGGPALPPLGPAAPSPSPAPFHIRHME